MKALLAEFLIPFLIHVNRNQRVSWGRRVIEPRQVDDRNQGKVYIQYSNVSTKAHAEEHLDFQANGLFRTRILSRVLAGRKIFRNMFRKGLSPQFHTHRSITSSCHIEEVMCLRAIHHQTSDQQIARLPFSGIFRVLKPYNWGPFIKSGWMGNSAGKS